MERFINILVVDQDPKIRIGLKEILSGSGNNVLLAMNMKEVEETMQNRGIGIFLINIDEFFDGIDIVESIRKNSPLKNDYVILLTKEKTPAARLVKGINKGAIDYLSAPFNPNLVRSKIEVYKSLFYKDQRIGQLLENIFPHTILDELSASGKYSPKRVQNGIVLFTDFVDFSTKAKKIKPLGLIKRLERYFTKFDQIIAKYNLEKIKTIGDAYMALAGVTENEPRPAIRACMAALEIQSFMLTERDTAVALRRDFWEIRIGMHMGPLVAGIIGSTKYSFDVWGDTVNVAARAEEVSRSGQITITSNINDGISMYFDTEPRGKIDIHKRGGSIEMFYLKKIKDRYSLEGDGRYPSVQLRKTCGLTTMDFDQMRATILTRLRSLLPEDVLYHDLAHTLNVEKAAMRFAKLEGVTTEEMLILRTAVLYHDSGYIYDYHENEAFGMRMAQSTLPKFGYTEEQIEQVVNIIRSTQMQTEPETLLQKIMCDADHDYLGRPDYYAIADRLRKEIAIFDREMSEAEWIDFQLVFLEKIHQYYTETAKNIRDLGKSARIQELRNAKEALQTHESLH